MRIAVASLMQETNTFNPNPTTLNDFAEDYLWRGHEMRGGFRSSHVEVRGFFDVLDAAGIESVPILAAHACSGGPLETAAFDTLSGELLERLERAGPLDGLLLALHGAMATEGLPDAEGVILEKVRSRHPQLPVAVSLDLHAHVTPRMVEHATLLVGYRTYPHVDMEATGRRVAELLLEVVHGRLHPVMRFAKRPMIVSPVRARTDTGPLAELSREARSWENSGRLVAASVFPVQPWLDVPDLGVAVVTIANGDEATARKAAAELADHWWFQRRSFEPELAAWPRALTTALRDDVRPTIIGNAGDAPSCGATGDDPSVLRALLTAGAEAHGGTILLILCDPKAAAAAAALGRGHEVDLEVGHGLTPGSGSRVRLHGHVTAVHRGPVVLDGPGANGVAIHPGTVALVTRGAIHAILTSRPVLEWDGSIFRAVGLEPSQASIVFVKSPSHFRAAFGDLAARITVADTPGASRCDLRQVPFTRVTRPLYPLDEGGRDATRG